MVPPSTVRVCENLRKLVSDRCSTVNAHFFFVSIIYTRTYAHGSLYP